LNNKKDDENVKKVIKKHTFGRGSNKKGMNAPYSPDDYSSTRPSNFVMKDTNEKELGW
jgi:hypothetical protein